MEGSPPARVNVTGPDDALAPTMPTRVTVSPPSIIGLLTDIRRSSLGARFRPDVGPRADHGQHQ